MSVRLITKRWSGFASESDNDARRATVIYDVEVDRGDSPDVARTASGIPQPGQPYIQEGVYDPFRVVRSVRANPRSPTLYEVRVRYGSSRSSSTGEDLSIHPLDRPPRIRTGFTTTSAGVDETETGEPIVTPNGEGFDPPPTKTYADQRITITRNEADINLWAHREYANAVNATTFFNHPPGTAKMAPIEAESAREEFDGVFVDFYRVTYTIDFRKAPPDQDDSKAWYLRILSQGFKVKIDGINGNKAFDLGNPPKHLVVEGGPLEENDISPITAPVRLDAEGFMIPDDSPEAHWLYFPIYEEKDLTVWNLE